MKVRILLLTLLFWVFAGCATRSTLSRPPNYYENLDAASAPAGLFLGDSAVLSDEDIQRILAYRYVPVPQNRIAVMAMERGYWFFWSDELSRMGNEAQSELIDILRASPVVYDASYLPLFLVPEKKTIPSLRQAAARYQADLLLIYRSSCRTYEKYRMLKADKSKAYCSVEAVLLDVRTGIIPFSAVASSDYTVEKQAEDMNIQDARRKAEVKALRAALAEVASSLVSFLNDSRAASPRADN